MNAFSEMFTTNNSSNYSVLASKDFKESTQDIPELRRIFAIIFLVIFLTGVSGNGLVVYVFAKNKAFRTLTNIFLLNLAIVDLVYLIVCCPFTTVKVVLMHWPFGNIACKLVTYLMVVCMCVNVMTLVAIGFDRFCAIVFPLRSKSFRNQRNICTVVVAIWLTSLAAFTPILTITRTVHAFETYCIEQLTPEKRLVYNVIMFVILYLLPQIFLGYLYAKMAISIRSNCRCNGRMTQVARVTIYIRYRIVKMTFAVSVAFAVCWLPMHIAAIMNAIGLQASYFTYYFQLYVPCFAYATVSVNPIIYCFMSKTFRKTLKASLVCSTLRFSVPLLNDDAELINFRVTAAGDSNAHHLFNNDVRGDRKIHFDKVFKDARESSDKSTEDILYKAVDVVEKECQTENIFNIQK